MNIKYSLVQRATGQPSRTAAVGGTTGQEVSEVSRDPKEASGPNNGKNLPYERKHRRELARK